MPEDGGVGVLSQGNGFPPSWTAPGWTLDDVYPRIGNVSGVLSYPNRMSCVEREGASFGFYVNKSIEEAVRTGNYNPVMCTVDGETFNSMGRPNAGLVAAVEEVAKSYLKTPMIVSISGNNYEEFLTVMRYLEQEADKKYVAVELNVSCPNVSVGEEITSAARSIGSDLDLVYDIVKGVKKITPKPVILKLSPNDMHVQIAQAAVAAGANYIGCSNTYSGEPKMRDQHILTGKKAGRSGESILKDNLKIVGDVYNAIERQAGIFAYGGVRGGIQHWKDVIDYVEQGANFVGMVTCFKGMSTPMIVDLTQQTEFYVNHYICVNYLKGQDSTDFSSPLEYLDALKKAFDQMVGAAHG